MSQPNKKFKIDSNVGTIVIKKNDHICVASLLIFFWKHPDVSKKNMKEQRSNLTLNRIKSQDCAGTENTPPPPPPPPFSSPQSTSCLRN